MARRIWCSDCSTPLASNSALILRLEDGPGADSLALEELRIAPRKSDLDAEPVTLVWTPWQVSPEGRAEPLFGLGDV
jgi:hypothetical protein